MKNEILDFQSEFFGQPFHNIIAHRVDSEKGIAIQRSLLQINDDEFSIETNFFWYISCRSHS